MYSDKDCTNYTRLKILKGTHALNGIVIKTTESEVKVGDNN